MKKYILLGIALLVVHLTYAQNNRSKAEVFIQILNRGAFTVSLDNESMSSSKGRFRFFDIYNAAPILSISQGDKRIYSQRITVKGEQRSIFTYDLTQGLRVYKVLPIFRNGTYALDDFDLETGEIASPRGNSRSTAFELLQANVRKIAFDDAKIDLILAGLGKGLSASEVVILLKLMSNDDKKLRIAKSAYHVIVDPQHAYLLQDGISLSGRKSDFLAYLKIKPIGRAKTTIRGASFEQLKEQVKRESFDDNRTNLIQNTLKESYLDTDQLRILLKLYTFEDAKAALARLLYYQIADQQNYYTIADVFTFNSSKDAFLGFIAQMQN